MKLKKKRSLTARHYTKKAKKYVELGKTPIIGVAITIADGATVHTSSEAVRLLAKALGEDTASSWHAKYMDKFDKLTKQAYEELECLVKTTKDKANKTSK